MDTPLPYMAATLTATEPPGWARRAV